MHNFQCRQLPLVAQKPAISYHLLNYKQQKQQIMAVHITAACLLGRFELIMSSFNKQFGCTNRVESWQEIALC